MRVHPLELVLPVISARGPKAYTSTMLKHTVEGRRVLVTDQLAWVASLHLMARSFLLLGSLCRLGYYLLAYHPPLYALEPLTLVIYQLATKKGGWMIPPVALERSHFPIPHRNQSLLPLQSLLIQSLRNRRNQLLFRR